MRRSWAGRDFLRSCRLAALLMYALLALGCSSESGNSGGSGGFAQDASSVDDGPADAPSTGSGSGTGGASGAGGAGGVLDPGCARANRNGFFPDCSLCGSDCDTIDDGTGTYRACGCTAGCPCGLHCGSFQIGPNVFVSDICVR